MVTSPPATPVTTPVVPFMVAIDVLLLLHEPPVVVLLSVVAAPAQTLDEPVIALGNAVTLKLMVCEQPSDSV